jgi:hypothetical protein
MWSARDEVNLEKLVYDIEAKVEAEHWWFAGRRQLFANEIADSLGADSFTELNSPLTNRILTAIFRLDIATSPLLRPPFGVSALVFAQKLQTGEH